MRADVVRAVEVLRAGGLVALPTETVYGLGADAENELAVRRIFAAKGRPATHPLIVHVADEAAAERWVREFPEAGRLLARAFWPGPLTLILPRSPVATDAVTGSQDTVGLRVPAHPLAQQLLRAFGGGVAAPSANRFGHVSPTTAAHVREELGDEVDFVLDGGPCSVGVESTIVDVSGPRPRLLRPGGVAKEFLEAVLGEPLLLATDATDVRAPGMLASHYAPRAGVLLVEAGQLGFELARRTATTPRLAVLGAKELPVPAGVEHLVMPSDAEGFARALYASLREADARGVSLVLAVPPAEGGLGLAVRDRLTRAASPRSSAPK